MRKLFFYCLFQYLASSVVFAAVDAPSLRCISVSAGGDVTLNWVVPSDPLNEFNSYWIYTSKNLSGPYSKLSTLGSRLQNSLTHTGAAGNQAPVYYYIVTHYGPGGSGASAPSDTLESMKITTGSISLGIARLSWNPVHSPSLPSSGPKYAVYKKHKHLSGWTFTDSIAGNAYRDTMLSVCDSIYISYRVVIPDVSGCSSTSSADSNYFHDNILPLVTTVSAVSVDSLSGLARLSWKSNLTRDLAGYYIFQKDKFGNWDTIGTAPQAAATYVYNKSKALLQTETYTVTAYDACGNRGLRENEEGHTTMLLKSSLDVCAGAITLTWTRYSGWKTGIAYYEIFVSEDGGPFNAINTLDPNTTVFVHSGQSAGKSYTYYVRAHEGSLVNTSLSNTSPPILFKTSSIPSFLNLASASVEMSGQQVKISWDSDPAAQLKGFKVLRSLDKTNFSQLAFIPSASASLTYVDRTAGTSAHSYYYRVEAVDTCGHDVKSTGIARTMLLNSLSADDSLVDLDWNDYEDWQGTILLHRSVSGVWEQNPVARLGYGVKHFTDNVGEFYRSTGIFCYYLEAVKADGSAISLSNTSCIRKEPRVYLPNTFLPSGSVEENRIFKPVNVFIDSQNYNLSVYNRWGLKVFETHDPNTGWDGQYKGELQPIGVYAYVISFDVPGRNTFVKSGSITLLR